MFSVRQISLQKQKLELEEYSWTEERNYGIINKKKMLLSSNKKLDNLCSWHLRIWKLWNYGAMKKKQKFTGSRCKKSAKRNNNEN